MKEKQKKRIIAVSLFLVVFTGIVLFGYYRILPSKQVAVVHADSLNTKLPPIQQPLRPLSKMEIYLQAEKDSIAKAEQRSRDPYVNGKNELGKASSGSKQTQTRISKLYTALDQAVNQKKKESIDGKKEEKKVSEKNDWEKNDSEKKDWLEMSEFTDKGKRDGVINEFPVRVQTHPLPSATQSDPELQQLSNMLDKLSALQNPVKPNLSKQVDSAIVIKAVNGKSIQAVVHQDQVLSNGGIIKLRLLQDITVDGVLVPRGSFVFGACHITDERLIVQITSISVHNQVFSFPVTVFDLDGMEGIYMPGAVTREAGKQGADNALQSLQLTSMETGIAAQAASAGIQTAKNLFSRKLRGMRVTAKAGHRVLLQKTSPYTQ